MKNVIVVIGVGQIGQAIAHGGSGVVIASQSAHRLPPLTVEQNGDGYRRMIDLSPVGRSGPPDEVGAVWFGDLAPR